MDKYNLKTMGNPLGGFAYRSGGWNQYNREFNKKNTRLNKTLDKVPEETANEQIVEDTKPVDDTEKIATDTNIDTTDRENRKDNKQLQPPEE
jgi:hypothetical protein